MLVVIVGIAYVAQVNSSSTRGFEVKDLQKHISTLRVENEQMQYQVDAQESVDHVTKELKMLGLVPVDQVAYASGTSGLAMK